MENETKPKEQILSDEDDFDLTPLMKKPPKEETSDEKPAEIENEVAEKTEEKETEKTKEKEVEQIQEESEKPKEVEEDFFVEESSKEEKKEESPVFDFKSIIEESGLDIDSEEIKTSEDFVKKIKETIDRSKQEIDLSKFDPQSQKLITHLNEGKASLEEFFNNPVISSMNNIIGMDPESKYRTVRYQELISETKDEDKAIEALETEIENMSKGELKTKAEEIDIQAAELRKNELEKIIQVNEEKIKKSTVDVETQNKKEKESLINYISKQDEFFGLKLSENAKKSIIRDIDTGNFNEVVQSNPQATKFYAYMIGRFGNKITQKMSESIKETSRDAYNKAQDSSFKALHEIEDSKKVVPGHQSKPGNAKKGFENWADETMFEG